VPWATRWWATGGLRSVGPVRLPSVPGPSDLLNAMGGVRDGVAEALALVPRVTSAVGRMEQLLGRVSDLLDRVDAVVDRADAAVDSIAETRAKADAAIEGVAATRAKADEAIAGVAGTREKADAAIEGVAATRAKADEAIASVGATIARADGTVGRAEGLVGRIEPLVGAYEPALTALAPSVRRLADTLDPQEVEALVTLIDRLPRLVTHLDEDILPVLESLKDVGTDVHDLVDTVQDLRQVVKGFPGSRLFRRRGAEEIAQEEADEAQAGAGS
jgi:ABC-type transporter Mla subunit MlaD